jgi:hypothetical protein
VEDLLVVVDVKENFHVVWVLGNSSSVR